MTTETLLKNGKAAAALLAGGIGAAFMGFITTLSIALPDFSKAYLSWYNPAGPLSGKTTLTVIVWLIVWAVLGKQWQDKDVDFDKIAMIAIVLLLLGILGTFPPFFDIFAPAA